MFSCNCIKTFNFKNADAWVNTTNGKTTNVNTTNVIESISSQMLQKSIKLISEVISYFYSTISLLVIQRAWMLGCHLMH